VLLDACLGYGRPDVWFTGYGPQHRDRTETTITTYRDEYGTGEWVTDYRAIDVEPHAEETRRWLDEVVGLTDVDAFVRPVSPDSGRPLPELVTTAEDLRGAIALLREFPAYPATPEGPDDRDRTVPVETLYRDLCSELDEEALVDLGSLSPPGQATGEPITGPVAAATPTSRAEAESKLLDYGRLTHLFRWIDPPSGSPIRQRLPVFALEWYRQTTESFGDLQDLAKFGRDDPVGRFLPRLRDLVHRRFLSDRWDYDFITVFPGHGAGSLSPQLVELAMESVVETSILYSPLLERTETTTRQREQPANAREAVAHNPGETLRVRQSLDGKTVILLDDICTTGSSLLAGAHLLRDAGARRVVGLTLGFTPGGPISDVQEIDTPDAYASELIAGIE
jgi:hypothetical protein